MVVHGYYSWVLDRRGSFTKVYSFLLLQGFDDDFHMEISRNFITRILTHLLTSLYFYHTHAQLHPPHFQISVSSVGWRQ